MDYAKLRGKIREVFGTNAHFAAAIGVNITTLSLKLNGKSKWDHEEIAKACEVLGIKIEEVHLYFFNRKL